MTNNELSTKRKLFEETLVSILEQGKEVKLPVYGMSMFPFLLPGDEVKVLKVDKSNLTKGDIVVFKSNGRLVAHRLIKLNAAQGWMVCKGDALIKPDNNNDLLTVIGVVFAHHRKGNEIKYIHSLVVKKALVFLTPIMGYINFYLGILWSKLS